MYYMYRGGKTITLELTHALIMMVGLLVVLLIMSLRDSHHKIADLHEITQDIQAQTAELLDIINPSYDEEADTSDSVEIADSHVQNDELQDRVARLKEEIANTTALIAKTPKHTPYITPLHPDVYNLPHETIPDTSHTIEYVK